MKFLLFASVATLVSLAVASLSAKADERGSRVVASVSSDFGAAKQARKVTIQEHAEDDGNLSLRIEGADGRVLRNDGLIPALDHDEDDVSSYHVTASRQDGGALLISSVKDWGTSNWSYGYTVALRDGDLRLSRFDFKLDSAKKHGACSLDLNRGAAVVNGRPASFTVPSDRIEAVDGIELERICRSLGMN